MIVQSDIAGYTLIDTAIIEEAIAQREEFLTRYNQIKDNYRQVIQHLLENWKGEGADAFRDDEQHIGKNIDSLFDLLKSMTDMLQDCLKVLQERDHSLGAYNQEPN